MSIAEDVLLSALLCDGCRKPSTSRTLGYMVGSSVEVFVGVTALGVWTVSLPDDHHNIRNQRERRSYIHFSHGKVCRLKPDLGSGTPFPSRGEFGALQCDDSRGQSPHRAGTIPRGKRPLLPSHGHVKRGDFFGQDEVISIAAFGLSNIGSSTPPSDPAMDPQSYRS